jgi:hypothetical protein
MADSAGGRSDVEPLQLTRPWQLQRLQAAASQNFPPWLRASNSSPGPAEGVRFTSRNNRPLQAPLCLFRLHDSRCGEQRASSVGQSPRQ